VSVKTSLLDDIKTKNNFNDLVIFKEWKSEDCQKKWWNGVHKQEGNEVDLNIPG